MQRIVVGVDGSESSLAALQWAVAEARLHTAEVEAVRAWTYPPLSSVPGVVPPPTFARAELASEERAQLARACRSVDSHGVSVRLLVMEGQAASCLLHRAEGADLLVVGSRGRGGFAGLLLGSVSRQCVHHASCPVAVIR